MRRPRDCNPRACWRHSSVGRSSSSAARRKMARTRSRGTTKRRLSASNSTGMASRGAKRTLSSLRLGTRASELCGGGAAEDGQDAGEGDDEEAGVGVEFDGECCALVEEDVVEFAEGE